jgi:5-(carboxyamino)imidazole ribonucleotide synthase
VTRPPILPPSTVGMLGGGQLGRYAVLSARTMGYRTVVLEPDPASPAGAVADEHLVAAYDDAGALDRLAVACDVVTTEFENVPSAALERLEASTLVAPPPSAVLVAQDRRLERRFLDENGFPQGPFREVVGHGAGVDDGAGVGDLDDFAFPALLKTARLGYDGKGQRTVSSARAVLAAWAELGGVACVLETRLDLDAEVSVLVARTSDARTAVYPVAENRHVDGILDATVLPARVDPSVADRAIGLALAVADALDFVGVLAVEMFVVGGELLVNELAPRPHNSGHWTLDASRTNQFEQQIRAVCGVALGDTAMTVPAVAMVNLLGDLWSQGEPRWDAVLDEVGASLHLYGKAAPRPGRKMGHVTVTGSNANEVVARALRLRENLSRRG